MIETMAGTAAGRLAAQQPAWPDPKEAASARLSLARLPALTTPTQVGRLAEALRGVQARQGFILHAGDCAEPFGREAVRAAGEKYRLLARMATTISTKVGLPVITLGRIGGQFAKPRSRPTEIVNGRELPVFRGLLVNSPEPDPAARAADPARLLTGYRTAAMILAELDRLAQLSRATPKMFGRTFRAAGGGWAHRGLWISHEALVLDYERPLVRVDPATGEQVLLSTHLPWIGDRTRQPEGAHVALLTRIANPVAVKLGPSAEPAEVEDLCDRLDPDARPGRLTFICRMGSSEVRRRLSPLVRAVRRAGHPVIWVCDPMHGNTRKTVSGRKTRHWADILAELDGFVEAVGAEGQWPGGVHLEVTGQDVTECLGRSGPADGEGLERRYESLCDPRLNGSQSLLFAEHAADRLAPFGSGKETW
ncbi:3-deoxy-7-phosphoheptulonate synthase [Amycolatopsis sp. NPDC059090]|uniref:3-deoxy-7-phosphoheptulonate synthase n=1 Tax=unclassified Amycolatopsis TaxID=2618356 RepID=UPI00366FB352